mgnify:CR=1 FL=1
MKDIKSSTVVNVLTIEPFDSAVLNAVINITVLKLKGNKAHSEIRQELSSYRFESPDKGRYQQLRDIFD